MAGHSSLPVNYQSKSPAADSGGMLRDSRHYVLPAGVKRNCTGERIDPSNYPGYHTCRGSAGEKSHLRDDSGRLGTAFAQPRELDYHGANDGSGNTAARSFANDAMTDQAASSRDAPSRSSSTKNPDESVFLKGGRCFAGASTNVPAGFERSDGGVYNGDFLEWH